MGVWALASFWDAESPSLGRTVSASPRGSGHSSSPLPTKRHQQRGVSRALGDKEDMV